MHLLIAESVNKLMNWWAWVDAVINDNSCYLPYSSEVWPTTIAVNELQLTESALMIQVEHVSLLISQFYIKQCKIMLNWRRNELWRQKQLKTWIVSSFFWLNINNEKEMIRSDLNELYTPKSFISNQSLSFQFAYFFMVCLPQLLSFLVRPPT